MNKLEEFKSRVPADQQDALLEQLLAGWTTEQQATAQGHQFKAADEGGGAAAAPAEDAADDGMQYVGDLSPEAFAALLTPIIVAAVSEAMGGAATKAAAAAEHTSAAQREALQATTDAIAALKAEREQAEHQHQATLATLTARLKALEGDVPAGVQQLRASQDAATVVTDGVLKGATPTPDPLDQVVNRMWGWGD